MNPSNEATEAAAALDVALGLDARIASAPDGYPTPSGACLDLDEAERIRYLYVEREMLLRYERSDVIDPAILPLIRATAHDEAIRQAAAARLANGHVQKVSWDDLKPLD